jgi:hypothetical protein
MKKCQFKSSLKRVGVNWCMVPTMHRCNGHCCRTWPLTKALSHTCDDTTAVAAPRCLARRLAPSPSRVGGTPSAPLGSPTANRWRNRGGGGNSSGPAVRRATCLVQLCVVSSRPNTPDPLPVMFHPLLMASAAGTLVTCPFVTFYAAGLVRQRDESLVLSPPQGLLQCSSFLQPVQLSGRTVC